MVSYSQFRDSELFDFFNLIEIERKDQSIHLKTGGDFKEFSDFIITLDGNTVKKAEGSVDRT